MAYAGFGFGMGVINAHSFKGWSPVILLAVVMVFYIITVFVSLPKIKDKLGL